MFGNDLTNKNIEEEQERTRAQMRQEQEELRLILESIQRENARLIEQIRRDEQQEAMRTAAYTLASLYEFRR